MKAAQSLDPLKLLRANAAMMIYKVLRPAEWQCLQAAGHTAGAPVDLADGFIHFSTAAQVHETVARHFASEQDIVLLACDVERFGKDLRWELSRGGALFPHLYRSLSLDEIAWSRIIRRQPGGHDLGLLE